MVRRREREFLELQRQFAGSGHCCSVYVMPLTCSFWTPWILPRPLLYSWTQAQLGLA